MELQEILPGSVSFKLENIPQELSLDMLTLDDNVWINENFPNIMDVFTNSDVKSIIKIIAKVLSKESKKLLASIKIVEVDEYGVESLCEKMTIAEKLQKLALDSEIIVVLNAFIEVRKRSNDFVAKITADVEKKRASLSIPPAGI